jgi:hypothetical protein
MSWRDMSDDELVEQRGYGACDARRAAWLNPTRQGFRPRQSSRAA